MTTTNNTTANGEATNYPPLVCDYCNALTPDPWHSSGMLHGKMSKHIHSCDACAGRFGAKAVPVEPADPMQWPLPCDVKVGHVTIRKGCSLSTLVTRMKVLYEMGVDAPARIIRAARAQEDERLTNELRFIANADVATWDDPSEFRAWAQNRARAAITARQGDTK